MRTEYRYYVELQRTRKNGAVEHWCHYGTEYVNLDDALGYLAHCRAAEEKGRTDPARNYTDEHRLCRREFVVLEG